MCCAPTYASYTDFFALVVFLPAIVGELSMALWLLVKGVGRDRTAPDDVLLRAGIHHAPAESI